MAFVSVVLIVRNQLPGQSPSVVAESSSHYFHHQLQSFRSFLSNPSSRNANGSNGSRQRNSSQGMVSSSGVIGAARASAAKGSNSSRAGQPQGLREEQRHVFFLKVHKAASTTVLNVLCRFALQRHLNVMLPKNVNILSESSKNWGSAAVALPPGVPRFDMLFNHLVFNEQLIRQNLYPDSKFIGIVREPLSQSVSAFRYYRQMFKLSYLVRIPGPDPLVTYLQSPEAWDHSNLAFSFTHNRMSFDFGMDNGGLMGNPKRIADYVTYLNRTFDLVMVSERFDESMVLLKRLLGWRLQDVIYIKSNVFSATAAVASRHTKVASRPVHQYNFTEEQRQRHRKFNAADYALYEHFSKLFQQRVEAQGQTFAEEVAAFKSLLQQVAQFCMVDTQGHAVTLTATKWSDTFQVRRSDCVLMATPEQELVSMKRREQLGRYVG